VIQNPNAWDKFMSRMRNLLSGTPVH
jgi:hypothetical protein